ncbi:hypothetical protein SteCoe_35235 [Stentor coeruleus]|uniref:Uncharacterized protein n=1 Tax=Stentor coeruleus TaxID=5963 RepID=A0A1R2ASR9_9CILI|nr:hypothetical protein SteCoe_35235 [Stentor coeruleus]
MSFTCIISECMLWAESECSCQEKFRFCNYHMLTHHKESVCNTRSLKQELLENLSEIRESKNSILEQLKDDLISTANIMISSILELVHDGVNQIEIRENEVDEWNKVNQDKNLDNIIGSFKFLKFKERSIKSFMKHSRKILGLKQNENELFCEIELLKRQNNELQAEVEKKQKIKQEKLLKDQKDKNKKHDEISIKENETQIENIKFLDENSNLKKQIDAQNIIVQEERKKYNDIVRDIENFKKENELKIKDLENKLKDCLDECIFLKQIRDENKREKKAEKNIKKQAKNEENLIMELKEKIIQEEKEHDKIKINEEYERIKSEDQEKKKQEEEFKNIQNIAKIEDTKEDIKTLNNQTIGIILFLEQLQAMEFDQKKAYISSLKLIGYWTDSFDSNIREILFSNDGKYVFVCIA